VEGEKMNKYPVNYGVNNSHITEWKMFDKYGDALAFFNNLPDSMRVAVIFKWEPKLNSFWQTVKKFKFEPGTDNTRLLNHYARFENGKLI
jgi:hypothetical protein